jgi:hypothetical protein
MDALKQIEEAKEPSANPSAVNHPTLFLDRALDGKRLFEALQSAGADVQRHRDHFAPEAPDTLWLPEVGARGWYVLTKDERIRYRALEQQALQNARVGAFILVSGNLTGEQMAKIFVMALPKIYSHTAETTLPFIAKIFRDSSVAPWI